MTFANYEYALGITSQLLYCGLPVRLDTYSKCQFGCSYCFAKARGGNFATNGTKVLDPDWLRRKIDRALNGKPNGVVDEFITRGIPLHIGGMSDPFPVVEGITGVTKRTLEALASRRYPAVISTKGNIFARDDYLEILRQGLFILQFSVCTASPALHSEINRGTPSLDSLFHSVQTAAEAGVPTVCRIQPTLPRRSGEVLSLIDRASAVGVKHVAVEHLKLAMENHVEEASKMSKLLGYDVLAYFKSVGAKRAGREWVLPLAERLPSMLAFRARAHAKGLTFGAADTDLLYLSDGECCCNATDLLIPGKPHYSFTMNSAIRRANKDGTITFASIAREWRPAGSIKRYVNSKSRVGITVDDHFRAAWNRTSHGPSLTNFFGVSDTGRYDNQGMKIYTKAGSKP